MERKIETEAQGIHLDTLLEVICGDLEQAGCPEDTMLKISICAEEIFVNICSYAYPEDTGTVTVQERIWEDGARFSFSDTGIPYDPLKEETPDITLSATQRQIGGLGIFLVKSMAQHTAYEYADGKNCFSMEFSWRKAPEAKESGYTGQEEKADGHQGQVQ